LARQTTWLLQAENLLLFGPSGDGKTHLAIAITMAMAAQDQACRFFSATTLVQLLQKALPRPQAERAGGTRPPTTCRRCSRSWNATPCW
jgi:DNA replication protein DnaC